MSQHIEEEFFDEHLAKNAYNIQSLLQGLYPTYDVFMITPNVIQVDFRLNRICIVYDDQTNQVLRIING